MKKKFEGAQKIQLKKTSILALQNGQSDKVLGGDLAYNPTQPIALPAPVPQLVPDKTQTKGGSFLCP